MINRGPKPLDSAYEHLNRRSSWTHGYRLRLRVSTSIGALWGRRLNHLIQKSRGWWFPRQSFQVLQLSQQYHESFQVFIGWYPLKKKKPNLFFIYLLSRKSLKNELRIIYPRERLNGLLSQSGTQKGKTIRNSWKITWIRNYAPSEVRIRSIFSLEGRFN